MFRTKAWRCDLERLGSLAAGTGELFLIYDVQAARITHVNAACQGVLGVSGAGLRTLPRRGLDLVHEADRRRAADLALDALAGRTVLAEFRIVRPAGEVRWLRVKAYALRAAGGGALERVIAFAEDVTDRRRELEGLQTAKEEAEQVSLSKTRMLASTSHEIRNPLGAVMGYIELLQDPELPARERVKYVEVIRRNAEILGQLVNDILDLSKVEAGMLSFESAPLVLEGLLSDLTSALLVKAMARGLTLTTTAAGDLPHTIQTDPGRLRQVLMNVIGNAIKFTERGGVTVQVSAEGVTPDAQGADDGAANGKLAFTVTDTGIGISLEERERLFEPFSQVHAVGAAASPGGTGLGLVFARELARGLGGDVTLAESTSGVGSTFRVEIPLSRERKEMIARPPPAAAPVPKPLLLSGRRVLLVEDSTDVRLLVCRLLSVAGALVETATDGVDAVRRAADEPFDVVLMDLEMPRLNGLEATRQLRRRGFDRPIIALTAHAMRHELDACLAAGFDDHLAKPVDHRQLLEMVRAYADRALGMRAVHLQ